MSTCAIAGQNIALNSLELESEPIVTLKFQLLRYKLGFSVREEFQPS